MPIPVGPLAFVCADCQHRFVINFKSDVVFTPSCPKCGGSCDGPQKASAFELLIARLKGSGSARYRTPNW